MNTEQPNQKPTRKPSLPFLIRWFAWGILILFGVFIVMMLAGIITSVGNDGWRSRKVPFFLFMMVFVVGFFCLKAATHPMRGRGDEWRAWKERFPMHTNQEVERSIGVVGDELGIPPKRWRRLRLDDRVAALTQEWLCGDGMDIVELLMAVESEYGLELPETFHERERTLGDLFNRVSQHRGEHPPTPDSARPDSEQGR